MTDRTSEEAAGGARRWWPMTAAPDGGKKLGWFFWVCVAWIAITVLAAVLANVLPIQSPTAQYVARSTPGRARPTGSARTTSVATSSAGWSTGRGSRWRSGSARWRSACCSAARSGCRRLPAGRGRRGRQRRLRTCSWRSPLWWRWSPIVTFWGHELWKITVIIGIAGSPLLFRMVRAATLSYAGPRLRRSAARALGASDRRVLDPELLPNIRRRRSRSA